jgi:hypothetical protein
LFKFHLVLPSIAVLIVARNWRALAGFFTGFVALLLGTFAVMGSGVNVSYMASILRYSRHISVIAQEKTSIMPNLRGLVAFTLGGFADARLQSVIVVSISIALLAVLLVWTLKFPHLPVAIRFSFVLAVTSLISYHYFPHNSVILLIPGLVMGDHFANPGANRQLRWIFIVTMIAFCVTTFGFVPLETGMPLLAIESIALAAVIFAIPYMRRSAPSAISVV